jgi:PAS domain S-box-containing protein
VKRLPSAWNRFGDRRWVWLIGLCIVVVGAATVEAVVGKSLISNILLATLAVLALSALAAYDLRAERRRFLEPIHRLVDRLDALAEQPQQHLELPDAPELAELVQSIERLRSIVVPEDDSGTIEALHQAHSEPGKAQSAALAQAMTRSGCYEPLVPGAGTVDPSASSEFTTLDMVSRLNPTSLNWIDSSPTEQEFLGWTLEELRQKSFLDIVHPDHRDLAREQLHASVIRGESHGLVYRIKTARGESKAIEMYVSVRYGVDLKVIHLRCHVIDVTAKLRAHRELRRRTRELTHANEQLRRINRELEELKDRYSDLYQNAPAMYFSLDAEGKFRECNNTLLKTLGFRRRDFLGRPFSAILPESRRDGFPARFEEFLRNGTIEVESIWQKGDGTPIDVWITAVAVRDEQGHVVHTRGVAQDVTARRALEKQLLQNNERLERANAELFRKNRELDEFTYVVSHDLLEPVRTLTSFSDFLVREYGERLDETGKRYVQFIVTAARRMRALINELLNLSRAGHVAGEFGPVDLGEVLTLAQADLAELIRERRARITVWSPLAGVWGDRGRIVQLLVNLIANGIKYNRSEEPRIEVGIAPGAVEEGDSKVTVFVKDNGIGIDPQFHQKIFQVFRQLHPRGEYEGTGAGLAICQRIVHAHGGRIWVESQLGRGASFLFTLPREPVESVTVRTEALHAS